MLLLKVSEKTVTIRWIEFDGIKFYPDRKGYWIGSTGPKTLKRLHVYVWEKYNGPVPSGYQVHHIDGNTDNNEIENLRLMSQIEHHSMHGKINAELASINVQKFAVPAAKEWHKSEEGHEWHKQHYQKYTAQKWLEMMTKTCDMCGKEFQTPTTRGYVARFCSNNCKSAWRRKVGLDNVERTCEICGTSFFTNKYNPARFCSKECRNKARSIRSGKS